MTPLLANKQQRMNHFLLYSHVVDKMCLAKKIHWYIYICNMYLFNDNNKYSYLPNTRAVHFTLILEDQSSNLSQLRVCN